MSPVREDCFVNERFYHVYSRSIAKYTIFNNDLEFCRMIELINLARFRNFNHKYSKFKLLDITTQAAIIEDLQAKNDLIVEIVAYCLMPTHIHFLLKQLQDDGIVQFMRRVLNSYSKFYNISHKRSGPLWAARFKDVPVVKDEQLLHLTRYIHLNPTSANLLEKPEQWHYSSLREYINDGNLKESIMICNFRDVIEMKPNKYKKFVDDRKDYQRQLSTIKRMLIDDYTG